MDTFLINILFFLIQCGMDQRPSHFYLPIHGTLHKNTLFGFFGTNKDYYGLDAIPVDGPQKQYWKIFDFPEGGLSIPPGNNFRHKVQYESFWFATGHKALNRVKFEDLKFFGPRKPIAYLKKYPNSNPHWILTSSLWMKYEKSEIQQFGSGFHEGYPTDILGYGSVPTSDTSIKSFILTKTRKRFEIWDSHFLWDEKKKSWETVPSSRFLKIRFWLANLGTKDLNKQAKAVEELEKLGDLAEPSLRTFLDGNPSRESRRLAQNLLEKIDKGEAKSEELGEDADNYEDFPSLFLENFYFFYHNKEYYFVTQSGKLYYAPPRIEKQLSRTMKPLWEDATRPIVAVIEDADNDRVWLFTKNKNKRFQEAVFFEIKDVLRPKPFDYAKLPAVNVEGRARILLEYLPLIRSNLKTPEKKKGK